MAIALAKSDASIGAVDINLEAAQEAVKETEDFGGKVVAV